VAAYEACVPNWSSGEVRTLRKYPVRALKDIPANIPEGGHFDTEGVVAEASQCPPCPPRAQCKPCPDLYADFTDGAAPPLRVELTSGVTVTKGKRYKLSVVTCAGRTPPRYELRGIVAAD
jgi:hypothetical protein